MYMPLSAAAPTSKLVNTPTATNATTHLTLIWTPSPPNVCCPPPLPPLVHQAFLRLVGCPRGSTLEGVMDSADALYGWPAAALGATFQKAVKTIQEVRGREEGQGHMCHFLSEEDHTPVQHWQHLRTTHVAGDDYYSAISISCPS